MFRISMTELIQNYFRYGFIFHAGAYADARAVHLMNEPRESCSNLACSQRSLVLSRASLASQILA